MLLDVIRILFILLLIFLNIICFKKKHFLCLFFPCMLFLPNYLGMDFSDALPVLTFKRIMFIVLFIYAYVNRQRHLRNFPTFLKTPPKFFYLLYGYFIFRIISNLYYCTKYSSSLKTILLILFEQLFLLIAVYLISPDKDERFLIIKSVVWCAVGVFILGIFESITSVKTITYALYTVQRPMWNDEFYRLGILRATSTLGLANYFGNSCILCLPLIFYLYDKLRQKRYLVAVVVTILAIIHSGCRSDLYFFFLIVFIYFIRVFRDKERLKLFLKNTLYIGVSTFVIIFLLAVYNPTLANYYSGLTGLVFNEFNPNFDEYKAAEVTEVIDRGSHSRLMQFTGLYHVATISPLTGLGSGAELRGEIQYYTTDDMSEFKGWNTFYSYDVGIVEIFCNEGLLGLIGVIMLLLFLYIDSKKARIFPYRILLPVYLMCTLSTSNMFEYIFLYIIIFSSYYL